MQDAKFQFAHRARANLKRAYRLNADLTNVHFRATDLSEVVAADANFAEADAENSLFVDTDMRRVNFTKTRPTHANFSSVNLETQGLTYHVCAKRTSGQQSLTEGFVPAVATLKARRGRSEEQEVPQQDAVSKVEHQEESQP